MTQIVHLDFETQSACDLKAYGVYRYGEDASTRVLCAVYRIDGVAYGWVPQCNDLEGLILESQLPFRLHFGRTCPPNLMKACLDGAIFCAHNSEFEKVIWTRVLKYKSPVRWFCTAGLCALNGLPRGLNDAAQALGIGHKHEAGHKVMMKYKQPIKGKLWLPTASEMVDLIAYCADDVKLEERLTHKLGGDYNTPRWNESRVWNLHDRVNERGIYVDKPLVEALLREAVGVKAQILAEFKAKTGLEEADMTRLAFLKQWMAGQGVPTLSLDEESTNELLARTDLPEKVRAMVALRSQAGRASLAKLLLLKGATCEDGRIRGALLYHGYNTGRWSGRGVQLHNLPKSTVRADKIEHIVAAILAGDMQGATALADGDAYEALVACIRPCLRASPGKKLIITDYSAVEARAVLWFADDHEHLAWWDQRDMYSEMATRTFGRPVTKKTEPLLRDVGKRQVLGCNFQCGPDTFEQEAAKYGINLKKMGIAAKDVVDAFRREFRSLSDWDTGLWSNLTRSAIEAVDGGPGTQVATNHLVFESRPNRVLFMWLPSGRRLVYRNVRIEIDPKHESRGIVADTQSDTNERFYGGKWADNATQGFCRDLLATTIDRCEAAGIETVLHVHDEHICEAAHEKAAEIQSVVTAIMCDAPAWAKNFPIKVESFISERYQK